MIQAGIKSISSYFNCCSSPPLRFCSYRQHRWRRGVSKNIQDDLRNIILFLVPNFNFQDGMNGSNNFINIKTKTMENLYHSSFSISSFTSHVFEPGKEVNCSFPFLSSALYKFNSSKEFFPSRQLDSWWFQHFSLLLETRYTEAETYAHILTLEHRGVYAAAYISPWSRDVPQQTVFTVQKHF